METQIDYVQFFVVLVALLLAVVSLVRSQRQLSIPTVVNEVQESLPAASDIVLVAREAVAAAEQLMKTGKIDRNERYKYAFERIRQWYPEYAGVLDDSQIANLIEGAVYALNMGAEILAKTKATNGP